MTPRQTRVTPVRECRFCHCTPQDIHRIPGGDECSFLGAGDRCSHPDCISAYEAEYDRMIARERDRRRLVRQLSKLSNGNKGKQRKQRKSDKAPRPSHQ